MGLLDEVLGAAMRGQQGGTGGGGLGDLLGGLLGGQGQQGGYGQQQQRTGPMGDSSSSASARGGEEGLGGMLGGLFGGGGSGGGGGMGQGAQAGGGGLAGVLGSLLGNDGATGGLGGLMHRFEQAGLGHEARSWVSDGPNAQVSGEQVNQALGPDMLSNIAHRLGVNPSMIGSLLASVLPMLIDRMTPHGQVPEQGFGDQHEVRRRLGGSL